MAMLSATLGTGLANLVPSATEPPAISAFADAWGTYFAAAMAGAVPYSGDPGDVAKSAMKAAMTGFSVTGAAAIQAGILAYWAAIVAAPATFFAASTVVAPPAGLAALAAALVPVFLANTVGSLSLVASANAIATAVHAANAGGSATFPPPVGPQVIA